MYVESKEIRLNTHCLRKSTMKDYHKSISASSRIRYFFIKNSDYTLKPLDNYLILTIAHRYNEKNTP